MSDTWVILGATSAMARAFAQALAAEGAALVLTGRDTADMQATAADCEIRGADGVKVMRFDARAPETFAPILSDYEGRTGSLNVAVFVGSMPQQSQIDEDPGLLDGVIQDSFTGPARFLQTIAPMMEARGEGAIVGVGSVAGDRGRIGNYVYGSAKAGFHTYLSGLRNRMGRTGIHVMTVKPGFVDTAMTWGIEGMFLVASPQDVARDILKGLKKQRNVLYTPWFWIIIMTIIRTIPERIFKKLSV